MTKDELISGYERHKAKIKAHQRGIPHSKHQTRWYSGYCLICGEHMECVTHYHARLHGYKSAEEMIADGKVSFDE